MLPPASRILDPLRDRRMACRVSDEPTILARRTSWPHTTTYKGMPLVCDASFDSSLKTNAVARPRAVHQPGLAMENIEDTEALIYPELISSTLCKLVALTGEVRGRWNASPCRFIRDLAAQRVTTQHSAYATRQHPHGKSVVEHDIVAKQYASAATLADAPHILHTWEGTATPLGILLRGDDIRISPNLQPPISPGLRPRTSRTTRPQTILN